MRASLSWLLVAAALAAVLVSCGHPRPDPRYTRDGVSYGVTPGLFNHRWWNYYQRGLSFADGEFWKEAEADLDVALEMNDRETRRAQTYGMHFTPYFPHRELGIVYYRQGRLEDAERLLARSLAREDSAKTHYYLAEVRGALAARRGSDTGPPRIILEPAAEVVYTSAESVVLAGELVDDGAVRGYRINDVPYYIREPGPRVAISHRLPLPSRVNTFHVTAEDLVGRAAVRDTTVVVDRTGPFVSLQPPRRTEEGWEISGSVSDEAPAALAIDGQPASLSPQGTFRLTRPAGTRSLFLHASDAAGNETRQEVTLGNGESRGPGWEVGALPTGTKVAAAESAGSIKLLRQPPRIVSSHYVALHLEVIAPDGIARLSVHGEPILGLPDRPRASFSQLVELTDGDNEIEIVLTDKAGRQVSRKVEVERRDPDKLLAAERLRLAYYELSPAGGGPSETDLAHRFNTIFEYQIAATPRFSVLERDRLAQLMLERELSVSNLADPKYAVRLNAMKIADLVLVGQVRARPDGIAAEARLVQTRTGRVATAMDVFHEKTDTATLEMLSRALAGEMEARFPVVRGRIVSLPEGTRRFVMDRGSTTGLREDLPVVVFSEKDFKVTLYGRGWIENVDADRAGGRLEGDPTTPLAVGLEVVTR